ncbi:FkbM family methyltransferase [Mechercharimyces sp. CAU 1602]|uniref:FkbM family methyltransferase n=1 Tax=Mechercharimyces sp. CAU 1602 TaxID=2973933 RepID=UPI0021618856|nr:FkbM family methyltransferase [Mechercharimyces sp. CAU 1602]MCS1351071.1 FkbM family methyltransferase [Mechercharimyces sp. CAU 1602]
MNGTYLGNDRMLIRPCYGGRLLIPASDRSITPKLMDKGDIDPHVTSFLLKNVSRGHTVVDVGAGSGFYTVLMGRRVGKEGRCISYEPHPTLYSYLRDNLIINGFGEEVIPFPLAAYSENKVMSFYQSERYIMYSSLKNHHPQDHQRFPDHSQQIEVQCVELDEHLQDLSYIHLLKLDIGGSECQALMGLNNLMKDRVGMLLLEYNRARLQDDIADLHELFSIYEKNYEKKLYELDVEGNLVKTNLQRIVQHNRNTNLVLI